jgi:hypothetical protein
MATKKTGARKVPATTKKEVIRHARIELPGKDYERLKTHADERGLSIAAYIRQAVLMQIRRDAMEGGGK